MLKEYDRQISGRLTPPQNARPRTVENKKTGEIKEVVKWNESGRIVGVSVEETVSQNGDNHDLYIIDLEITGTKGSGEHVGSRVQFKGRINPEAWDAGDKDDGQFKMSRGTLIRLTQFVRSSGFPVKGGLSSAQMAAYFPANGQSPLIGREVYFEISQETSDFSPSGWNEEIRNVFPLATIKPQAEV
jgi:hypothetical protein